MPDKARRQRHALAEEKRLRAEAENRLAQAEARLRACNGFAAAPIYRPATTRYDWHCGICGYVNYAGRLRCHASGCIGHRQLGETIVGQARGMAYDTPRVREDRRRQQFVPSSRAPSPVRQQAQTQQAPIRAVGLQPKTPSQQEQAATPVQGTRTPGRSYAQVARAHSVGGVQTSGNARPAEQATQRPEQDGVAEGVHHTLPATQGAAMGEEDGGEDDASVTLQEDADASTLQRRLRGLEKRRRKQLGRIDKQDGALRDKKEEIAMRQAELIELQAEADQLRDQLRETDEIVAELSSRLAELTAQRVRDDAEAEQPASGTAEEARQCLQSALHGLQTFSEQPPELQAMLRHFAATFEAMQQADAEVRQQGVLKQSQGPGTQWIDIHSNASSSASAAAAAPADDERQQASMEVDKYAQGEKRKLDAPEDEQCSVEARPGPALLAIADAPKEPSSSSEQSLVPYAPTRKGLVSDLKSRVAEKVAEQAARSRSSPYGHG